MSGSDSLSFLLSCMTGDTQPASGQLYLIGTKAQQQQHDARKLLPRTHRLLHLCIGVLKSRTRSTLACFVLRVAPGICLEYTKFNSHTAGCLYSRFNITCIQPSHPSLSPWLYCGCSRVHPGSEACGRRTSCSAANQL